MKKIRQTRVSWLLFAVMAGIGVHILGAEAVAGENAGSWRGTYDTVMLWINFGILAFIIIRFGKTPIMSFLKGRKAELENEISALEAEKEAALTRIRETSDALDQSEVHFEQLRQKIVEQGEKRRQEIIEDARQQSHLMLEGARQKVESQLLHAKKTFRAELIDSAIDLATQRLPKEIMADDHQRLVDDYLTETSKG